MENNKRLEKIPSKYRKDVLKKLKSISTSIQQKREEQGLTQEELAEELGISVMTIQFIEQGRRYPSVQMLLYIYTYLEISF
jgi:transcriptional regulator with XRE-family HTH domain